ncbi:hypothetical protein JCM11641_000274 [Rhodosporidiobolus odoratus]
MATLDAKTYSTTFSGLKSTAITAGCFIVGGLVIKEVLQRLTKYPDEARARKRGEPVRDRGMEGWAMGYLYRARTFVAGPKTADYRNYPLSWVIEAYKRDEKYYETHCGADATVYVRFIRGTFFWITFHLFTTFPILLAINFHYAPANISRQSLDRASLSALVQNKEGLHLLPIHVLMMWIVVFSWVGNLIWIGYGTLRIRRNELRRLLRDEVERRLPAEERHPNHYFSRDMDPEVPQKDVGWRYRTVLVRNIPPVLRTEDAIRGYFEQYLRSRPSTDGDEARGSTTTDSDGPSTPTSAAPLNLLKQVRDSFPMQDRKVTPSAPSARPLISSIVLVRRTVELNELYAKYGEVLHQLETAHVALVRNVVEWVQEKVEREEEEKSGVVRSGGIPFFGGKKRKRADLENEAREGDDLLLSTLRPFLPTSTSPPPLDHSGAPLSLWTVIHSLHSAHPTLLDRFQPLTRLRYFRSQSVPSIDYYLAKHNLLFCLIDDKRARLPEGFEAASTAFVTFERAEDARRARKELKWRPLKSIYRGRVLDFKVKMAPETRDLHWDRLVLVSLSSDLLRGTFLQILIWAATLFWVLPISFLIGLLSLESLTDHLPKRTPNQPTDLSLPTDYKETDFATFPTPSLLFPILLDAFLPGTLNVTSLDLVAAYLEDNPVANSLFTSLLPTAIVAVLNLFVPTVLGIIQRKGKTLITESKWSAQTQAVYWKFVAINFLIVFCIGITAFTSFLNAFRQPTSVLDVIAAAFPKGATFFSSYMLLQAGIHTGIEISLLGISWINHASIRKYIAPRKRALDAVPRFFGFQSWIPNHLFIVSICLIFAVLNPLVIAFGFIYFTLAVLVFKQQFAHVYYRRHFEGGGRVVFRRVFRYSLDIAVLAELIYVSFFWVLKRFSLGGAVIPLIPLTVATKIIGSRWFDHLVDEIEEAQIDVICGEGDAAAELSVPLDDEDRDLHLTFSEAVSTIKTFATVTLPALALHPAARLPKVSSPSRLAAHWKARSEAASVKSNGKRSRANSFQMRPRSQTSPDDWRRPMLDTIMSREEGAPTEVSGISPSPSLDQHGAWAVVSRGEGDEIVRGTTREDAPEAAAPAGAPASIVEEASKTAPLAPRPTDEPESPILSHAHHHASPIVRPHPPVVRDDRPVSHLHYRNPAEVVPLSRCLWLPADPLRPVDLGDTIDYSGRALVSSEGGRGVIGSWEENPSKGDMEEEMWDDEVIPVGEVGQQLGGGENEVAEDRPAEEEKEGETKQGGEAVSSSHARATSNDHLMQTPTHDLTRRGSRQSMISLERSYTLRGTERIRVAADVAAKIEAEQGGRQLSVLDGGMMRRRGSSSASQRSPSIMSSVLQRKGTKSSAVENRSSSIMIHSPHHAPVLLRHPNEARPSPPAIPVFTDEPDTLDVLDSSTPRKSSAYPFPPRSPRSPMSLSPIKPRRNTGASSLGPPSPSRPSGRDRSPSDLTSPTRAGSRLSIHGPISPTSPTSPTARTRSTRAVSRARSMHFPPPLERTSEEDAQEVIVHSAAEGDGGPPAVSLSQAAALRAELLEEERKAHEEHEKREAQRMERERKDREDGGGSGWLRRVWLRSEVEEEADTT